MKVAICDDDKMDNSKLKELIVKYDAVNNIGLSVLEYSSGISMIRDIENGKKADIIFLDINMNDMDGLTVARKIREVMEDVPIILVTAFMNYALDGYKVRASRFLVKDDLESTFSECMDDICDEIRRKTKTILLSCVEGDINFKIAEIVLIETSKHKCMIHLLGQVYQIYEKIDHLEKMLDGLGFIRIHQSYLVNMRYIRNISGYILTLTSGGQLPVPKARYKQVKQKYILYAGKEL